MHHNNNALPEHPQPFRICLKPIVFPFSDGEQAGNQQTDRPNANNWSAFTLMGCWSSPFGLPWQDV